MARVTVEDCIVKIQNRFELVMVAAQRARKIGSGAALTVSRDNDKNPVVALREIADETIPLTDLQEELVRNHQRIVPNDDDAEDVIDEMDGEAEWNAIAARQAESGFSPDEFPDDDEEEEDEPSLEDLAGDTPKEE